MSVVALFGVVKMANNYLTRIKVMSTDFLTSKVRLVSGLVLFIVGLLVIIFLVPRMHEKNLSNSKLKNSALLLSQNQEKEFNDMWVEIDHIQTNQQLLDRFVKDIPFGDTQKFNWELSNRIFDLSSKYGVKVLGVKYAPTLQLDIAGDALESLIADFEIDGVYIKLTSFMAALEKANRNFIVTEARLVEGAEGGHLVVKMFILWRRVSTSVTPTASRP
jgi:hypothetical protein